jgi:hypothetical protein
MDSEALKQDLFYLIGYLLSSAHGLYHEPGEYGIYRLMDAAGRLVGIMAAQGLADDFLLKLGEEIDQEKTASMDDDRQKATIERLAMEYSKELQRRLEGSHP